MRILYATDGSKGALDAAHLLASLPLDPDCQLMISTVVPHFEEEAEGRAALATAREALIYSTANLTTHVRRGDPAETILRVAEDQAADLVVVGSRGLSTVARFFLGSVAERVAHHAACPVLLVRPHHTELHRVLVGVDGSECSAQSIQWLRAFPLPVGSEVRVVTVVPSDEVLRTHMLLPLGHGYRGADGVAEQQQRQAQEHLEGLVASLATAGKRAVTDLWRGDPALALIQGAEDYDADLIVVGSHGHSEIERFFIGSVSEKVLRHAHCSVMITKRPLQRERCVAGLALAPAMSRNG